MTGEGKVGVEYILYNTLVRSINAINYYYTSRCPLFIYTHWFLALLNPCRDERLWRVEYSRVVTVLEGAAKGHGEDGEGEAAIKMLKEEEKDRQFQFPFYKYIPKYILKMSIS
jgi:hypothetical protein